MQVAASVLWLALGLSMVSGLAGCEARPSPPANSERSSAEENGGLALSPRGREAFERLLVAAEFTSDATGYGGTTPNAVIALRRLALEPNAARAFAELEEQAALGGRLYALCGLYYADPINFQVRAKRYAALNEPVFYQSGCLGSAQPVHELVKHEEAVQLAPGQSLQQYYKGRAKGSVWRCDILGGGWPNLLVKGGGFYGLYDQPYSGSTRVVIEEVNLTNLGIPQESSVGSSMQTAARVVSLSDKP